jgi:hypothetical protein
MMRVCRRVDQDESDRSDLDTDLSSAQSSFQVLSVSRDLLLAGQLHILFEGCVLSGKNMQVGIRLGVGGSFATEDVVVHENLASARLNGSFPQFVHHLHGQRARECKGEESEEGEDGDDKGEALHAEGSKSNEGK